MSDNRKVSTDALETLGNIIGPDEKRDAIHLAVIPMQSRFTLSPGDDVNAKGEPSVPYAGIVDPFLKEEVRPGQWFWLVIYPRQITSLRHVWSHPSFPEELAEGTVSFSHSKQESESWLRAWVHDADMPFDYDQFLILASEGSLSALDGDYAARIDYDYIYVFGRDAGGEIPVDVWYHLENVLGRKVPYRPTYFSCSC